MAVGQWAESASVSATATAAGSASAISSRMAVPDPYAAAGRRMGEGLGRATASSIFDSDEAPPRNGQHVRRQPLEGISGVEDDSCSGTAAVLGSEGPQMPGITESGVSRSLDFDGQESSGLLNDDINFFTQSRSPVEEFGPIDSSITPGEQIMQNKILEMEAAWFQPLGKVEGDAGVAPEDSR